MRLLTVLLSAVSLLPGCSCSRMQGKVDDLSFTRCAQADAPDARKLHTAALDLELDERLIVVTPRTALRIAAFTGPVGAPLSRADLEQLSAAAAELVIVLGSVAETPELAALNLTALASLHVPVLVVAGGADRYPALRAAFDDLAGEAAEQLIDASAVRELRIGSDRFAIVAGAPNGRYALDDEACGFGEDDLDDVADALAKSHVAGERVWLLSWAAPSGFGVSLARAKLDVGSTELAGLAKTLGAQGGVFAYPETQALMPSTQGGALAIVAPRLGRTGSARNEGARLPRSLALLGVGTSGLALVK